MFETIADIKAAASSEVSSVPLWFSEDTMEFFNTRVMDEVFNMGEFGSLFITADRPDLDSVEGFAIRWAYIKDEIFYITTLGDIMAYASLGEAWNAASGASDVLPDIVRFMQ